jgi:hypothetical protein
MNLIYFNYRSHKRIKFFRILMVFMFSVSFASHAFSNSQQELKWTRFFGTLESSSLAADICTDDQENAFLLINTNGDLGFFKRSKSTEKKILEYQPIVKKVAKENAFLIKYKASGQREWTIPIGGSVSSMTKGFALATDKLGNIYVVGNISEHNINNNGIKSDAFIMKFNSEGKNIWTHSFYSGVQSTAIAKKISISEQGSIYIFGDTDGQFINENRIGKKDAFLIKLNSDGNTQWTKIFGYSQARLDARFIKVDNNENIIITGITSNGIGEKQLKKIGYKDTFILKLSSEGKIEWQKILGVLEGDFLGASLELDKNGNVYLAGSVSGNHLHLLTGNEDSFLAMFNANGEKKWLKLFGTSKMSTGYDDLKIFNNEIFVVGYYSGNNNKIILNKFDLLGNKTFEKMLSHSSNITKRDFFKNSISIDDFGNLFIAGSSGKNVEAKGNSGGSYDGILLMFKIENNTANQF